MTYTGGARSNCAGEVRNFALQFVTTEWVAFLDDDDTISRDYVQVLQYEMSLNPTAELISFRMFDEMIIDASNLHQVLPEEYATDVYRDHVGISFAFRLTNSRSDFFIKSMSEDYLFIHNFCHDSGRLCILSPYINYYVKGRAPKKLASVGNRTIIRATTTDLHHALVIDSTSACYSPYEVLSGAPSKISSSGDLETTTLSTQYGLKLKLHDTAKSCPLKYEGIDDIHVLLSFAELPPTSPSRTIYVVHSRAQLAEVWKLSKQSFLWTISTSLKSHLTSAGFESTRIKVINPWSILDTNDDGPCVLHDVFSSSSSVESSRTHRLSVVLLDTQADDPSGVFKLFCADLQLTGLRVICEQMSFDHNMLKHACSADIVIFSFHDEIPEWLPVAYLILRGKVVLFNSFNDQTLGDFFLNFAHTYDSPAAALSTIVTMSKNWDFFLDVSRRVSTAFYKVIDEAHHEELCLALDEYAAVVS